MKIKCLIVDDEQLGRDLIATHLQQLDQFELVASCASAIEAMEHINQNHIDLLFLDIEMPVLKGTDFYRSLKHKPQVIFTTAYRDYALDGFDLEAVDYLLKPITFARFFQAIERFKSRSINPPASTDEGASLQDHVFIRANRKAIKVCFKDVLYVQGLKDYLQVHTTQGTVIAKLTMKSFMAELPDNFIQVHKSYIINLHCVTAYTQHDLEIDDIEIPIGETYQTQLLEKLKPQKPSV